MTAHSTIDITLLGREYRVTCPPEERDSLLASVAYVDAKMNEIAAKSKSNTERVAVMTALNLAHELLDQKEALAKQLAANASLHTRTETPTTPLIGTNTEYGFDTQEFARRIEAIQTRIDAAMVQQDTLL